ncbi:MAG: hypothetical protein HY434_00205 [Candidatus Liptonbacteria bacterium]|nr:hypothetical protein [Candidatus Liptonbacteria bacterium]
MKVFIEKAGVILKRSLGFILLLSISGTSVALATLTFTGTSMTTDNFVGFFGGLVGVGATTTGVTFYVQSQSVGTTTVQLQGLAGQTARLFAVASSSGVNTFEILSGGVASSSDFRSTSSTFATLNGTLSVTGVLGIGANSTNSAIAYLQSQQAASTTLLIQATTSQTGNLFTVASGSAQRFFEILAPTGVASSTQFRSPSSSVDVLAVPTSITLGGGTAMTKMVCNSTSSKFSSTATTATSTVGIEVAGLSTSTNQAYWWNIASTSAGFADLELVSVQVSSTISSATPRADLYLRNLSSATFAPAGNATTTLCYTQF